MCKATQETIKQIQKSHMAISKTISNLGAETNRRLTALEERESQTHEVLKDIRLFLKEMNKRL